MNENWNVDGQWVKVRGYIGWIDGMHYAGCVQVYIPSKNKSELAYFNELMDHEDVDENVRLEVKRMWIDMALDNKNYEEFRELTE